MIASDGLVDNTRVGTLEKLGIALKDRQKFIEDLKNNDDDIREVQSSGISKEDLVEQFVEFAAEAAATLEKAKGKERLAEIINEIAGWLGVESEEQSPNRKANIMPYYYLPSSTGTKLVTQNGADQTGLNPSGLLELKSNRTEQNCPCSPQQIFPSHAVPYATCDQWGTRWNCGYSYPTATKVNGRWQCSGVCTVRCSCTN